MSDYFKLYDEKGNVDTEAVKAIPTPHKLLLPLFELSPVDKQKSFLQAAVGVKSSAQSKRNRAAGQKFERDVAAKFGALFPRAARRSQYTGGRKDGCDVEGTPYWIECKYCDTMAFPEWWRKAECDSAYGRDVVIVYRRPHCAAWVMFMASFGGVPILVHSSLDDFLSAVRRVRRREIFDDGSIVQHGRLNTDGGMTGWMPIGKVSCKHVGKKTVWDAEAFSRDKDSAPVALGTFPTRDAAEKAVRLAWEDGGADE